MNIENRLFEIIGEDAGHVIQEDQEMIRLLLILNSG